MARNSYTPDLYPNPYGIPIPLGFEPNNQGAGAGPSSDLNNANGSGPNGDNGSGGGGGIPFFHFGGNPLGTAPMAQAGNIPSMATTGSDYLSQVQGILNSPQYGAAMSGIGGAMSAYGKAGQQQQANQMGVNDFAANMANNRLNADRNFQFNQATAANAADPLGAVQGFAQKQALAKLLLGGARNSAITPGDPAVAAAMGQQHGGMQLPAGGIDPAMLDRLFGDAATQSSIAQHEKQVGQINPNAPSFDLSSIYGSNASPYQADIQNSNNQAQNAQSAAYNRQQQIIQNAIDNNMKLASKKPSKLGAIFGGLASAAPLIGHLFGL